MTFEFEFGYQFQFWIRIMNSNYIEIIVWKKITYGTVSKFYFMILWALFWKTGPGTHFRRDTRPVWPSERKIGFGTRPETSQGKMVKKCVFQELSSAINDIFRNWKIISAMLCMPMSAKKAIKGRPRALPTHNGRQKKS